MHSNLQGVITDIQRCSVHDGPGIRTTVFLKGCNMRCAWCHNPETISTEIELMQYPEKCIGCGLCEKGCYSGAKVVCGKVYSVEEVLDIILLDKVFYGESGGVTISGGEPLLQVDFTVNLLKRARLANIGTAVESNLSFAWDKVKEVASSCDLVMADLKAWSDRLHTKWTGISNVRIKENFRKLDGLGIPIIMRTPVIPGVNDTVDEIKKIGEFASSLDNLLYYELLPYHPLGEGKGVLESGFQTTRFPNITLKEVDTLAEQLQEFNIDLRVAGRIIHS